MTAPDPRVGGGRLPFWWVSVVLVPWPSAVRRVMALLPIWVWVPKPLPALSGGLWLCGCSTKACGREVAERTGGDAPLPRIIASGGGGGACVRGEGGGGSGTQKSKNMCTKNSPNQDFLLETCHCEIRVPGGGGDPS